jgi:hypothetical protein
MTDDFKVISVIVCEDIRKEWNAKEMLIGVLPSTIFFPTFPIMVPSIGIRITFQTRLNQFDDIIVEMQGPDGVPVFSFNGPLTVSDINEYVALTVLQAGVEFKSAGEYKIIAGPRGQATTIYAMKALLNAPPTQNLAPPLAL